MGLRQTSSLLRLTVDYRRLEFGERSSRRIAGFVAVAIAGANAISVLSVAPSVAMYFLMRVTSTFPET
jgi:hypothetical protein